MNKNLLYLILFLCLAQITHSQENGLVALDLPIRNSLKFNKYAVNPTFSFVREQNKHISFSNKRQWVQFENAPQTYLFSYSGRFRENIGAGIGLFQQNYGVQTVFGGVLNFAYNAVLNRDNNLTFGLNIGAYQSSINEGEVITNFPDPALQNIPKHTLLTVNPGINYGTAFFDFGLSVNNLVSYNLNTSELIEDNPEQSFQAHVMYTGYMNSRGFFDESKFSTLIRSEFKKETTVVSGLAMLSIPKGMWGQVGYNTLYGASAGVGINISEQIALEYNYEQSIGELSAFGNSHEITVAYRFKNNNRYLYSGDDDEKSVFTPKRRKRTIAKRKPTTNSKPKKTKEDNASVVNNNQENKEVTQTIANNTKKEAVEIEAQERETSAEEINSEKEKQKAAAEAKAIEEARLKVETEEAERLRVEEAKKIQEAQEAKIKAVAEERARIEAERLQAEQEKQRAAAEAKAIEEARLKAEAEEAERLRVEGAKKIQEAQEAEIKAAAEEKARIEAERLQAEQEKQRAAAEAKAIEEARLKAEAEEAERLRVEEAKKIQEAQEAEIKAAAGEKARIKAEKLQAEQEKQRAAAEPELDKETANSIKEINQSKEQAKEVQKVLIDRLTEKVAIKQKDLDDLKEENDLSEKGVYVAPKPFKSISKENAEIESLKEELDKAIEEQRIKVEELETVYLARKRKVRDDRDPLNTAYLKAIEELKAEQLKTTRAKANLEASLATIKVATEVERKRRIKRAAYDNQKDRYKKDSASLAFIKKFTDPSTKTLTEEDFDFGEEPNNNIQIVKNVSHAESGYYMVIAVHNNEAKRDEFLTKAVSAGRKNINFFFDVNTNKYFIYYNKFNTIQEAQRALQSKKNKPYNAKMSIVKIEN